MVHVIEFHWIYLALACVLGCLVGVMTWNNRLRGSWLGGWLGGWLGWALALFAIGVIVALVRVVPGRYGLYLELALLFFAAYVIGCLVGGGLRMLFAPVYHGGGADQEPVDTGSRAVPAAQTPAAQAPAAAAPLVSQPQSNSENVQYGAPVVHSTPSPQTAVTTKPVTTQSASKPDAGQASDAMASAPAAVARLASAPVAPAAMGVMSAPLGGKPDDLKRIRGIGPTLEKKLNGTGIFHFSQIAAWTEADVEAAGALLSFQGRIEREDWIAQAKLLASGGETEFSRRVDDGDVPSSRKSDG